ncbi:MAG: diacylglycerol kinase family lipid kinase [Caldilineaceae bacterium]|nr:diacylglycerol kinase family lipid kinase [Caldilineaceae bacterium]
MTKRVHVIINPASGQSMPILYTLNQIFRKFDYDWEVSITKQPNDGYRLAKEAVAAGFDIVAAYGGDGTVAEVASGLIGSDVPMAILPGGTANVMSVELGIPNDLNGACELFCGNENQARWVDMGQIGDRFFLLRVGIGFEAAMVKEADREAKAGMGVLAYLLSALSSLRNPPHATYRITMDGKVVESEGMTCLVANSGSLGRTGLSLMPDVKVDDGLLDVIVVRQADLRSFLAITANVAGLTDSTPVASDDDPEIVVEQTEKNLQHWQAREIEIETDPIQSVQSDGEMIEDTPIHCRVLPKAIQILVPTL